MGLNPEGDGIWQIRKFGWHELVFRPSYLINRALPSAGFKGTLTVCPQSPLGNTIIAVRTKSERPNLDIAVPSTNPRTAQVAQLLNEAQVTAMNWKETTQMTEFAAAYPQPQPDKSACVFYHAMTYPGGESVDGAWDIRGLFDKYIGHYPIAGKTLLDVGTAGGFLAFEAEKAGAKVTALDALCASEFDRIPRKGSLYGTDRRAHDAQTEAWFTQLKNGFWYSWHRYHSDVEMVYAPLARLPYWERQFDIVLAGAILEHLANPVGVIGNLARLAKEAVIIGFTPVTDSDAQFMETANDWSSPEHCFTFWTMSRGLYQRIFANLGFAVEFVSGSARTGGVEYSRPTIIARRG
jgi:2-polyprenyl-3-methyl-5-hydroxy-6-metoxy-1,4-benzoquinol methylase